MGRRPTSLGASAAARLPVDGQRRPSLTAVVHSGVPHWQSWRPRAPPRQPVVRYSAGLPGGGGTARSTTVPATSRRPPRAHAPPCAPRQPPPSPSPWLPPSPSSLSPTLPSLKSPSLSPPASPLPPWRPLAPPRLPPLPTHHRPPHTSFAPNKNNTEKPYRRERRRRRGGRGASVGRRERKDHAGCPRWTRPGVQSSGGVLAGGPTDARGRPRQDERRHKNKTTKKRSSSSQPHRHVDANQCGL